MAQETAQIKIDFVDMENQSYPAKRVVISNGETIMEFHNITGLQESIPVNSSLKVVWNSAEYDTMEQIPLRLSPGQNYNFKFYCLDRAEVVQQARPYILFEEEGSNPNLEWQWDENNKRLTAQVQSVEGKMVEVVSWVDVKLSDRPNSALIASSSNATIDTWSACIPPNINIDGSFGVADGNLEHEFTTIEDTKQLVGIRKATYNEHIVDTFDKEPFKSILKNLNGEVIDSNLYWPQYAVDAGYYHIKADGLPSEFAEIELPLKIELDKVGIFELYPPKLSEVGSFQFLITGEYYHTRAQVTSVIHDSDQRQILAYTNANGDMLYSNGYFGAFILPMDANVNSVSYTDTNGDSHILNENEDYIIQELSEFLVCNIRIPLNSVRVSINY